jgi:hypothetical protein
MADEPDSLWLIPRAVRDKLDRIGVKLHLREWQELSFAQRQQLCDEPCGSVDYAARYRDLLRSMLGREPEPLMPKDSPEGR